MARLSSSTLLAVCLLVTAISTKAGEDHLLSWLHATTGVVGGCRGSIAECMAESEYDTGSSSSISRRILANSDYISYGSLQRNTVPCSKRGASYYNCQEGAEANPYSRQCSAITRCRS